MASSTVDFYNQAVGAASVISSVPADRRLPPRQAEDLLQRLWKIPGSVLRPVGQRAAKVAEVQLCLMAERYELGITKGFEYGRFFGFSDGQAERLIRSAILGSRDNAFQSIKHALKEAKKLSIQITGSPEAVAENRTLLSDALVGAVYQKLFTAERGLAREYFRSLSAEPYWQKVTGSDPKYRFFSELFTTVVERDEPGKGSVPRILSEISNGLAPARAAIVHSYTELLVNCLNRATLSDDSKRKGLEEILSALPEGTEFDFPRTTVLRNMLSCLPKEPKERASLLERIRTAHVEFFVSRGLRMDQAQQRADAALEAASANNFLAEAGGLFQLGQRGFALAAALGVPGTVAPPNFEHSGSPGGGPPGAALSQTEMLLEILSISGGPPGSGGAQLTARSSRGGRHTEGRQPVDSLVSSLEVEASQGFGPLDQVVQAASSPGIANSVNPFWFFGAGVGVLPNGFRSILPARPGEEVGEVAGAAGKPSAANTSTQSGSLYNLDSSEFPPSRPEKETLDALAHNLERIIEATSSSRPLWTTERELAAAILAKIRKGESDLLAISAPHTGKTYLAGLVARAAGKKGLIVVSSVAGLKDAVENLKASGLSEEEIGVHSGKSHRGGTKVTVAVNRSLGLHTSDTGEIIPAEYDVVVVDDAQGSIGPETRNALARFPHAFRIGFSSVPNAYSGYGATALFPNKTYHLPYVTAAKTGVIVPPSLTLILFRKNYREAGGSFPQNGDPDFQADAQQRLAADPAVTKAVVEYFMRLTAEKGAPVKAQFLCADNDHASLVAQALNNALKEKGYPKTADSLTSTSPQRSRKAELFRESTDRQLITVRSESQAQSDPTIELVVLLVPGTSDIPVIEGFARAVTNVRRPKPTNVLQVVYVDPRTRLVEQANVIEALVRDAVMAGISPDDALNQLLGTTPVEILGAIPDAPFTGIYHDRRPARQFVAGLVNSPEARRAAQGFVQFARAARASSKDSVADRTFMAGQLAGFVPLSSVQVTGVSDLKPHAAQAIKRIDTELMQKKLARPVDPLGQLLVSNTPNHLPFLYSMEAGKGGGPWIPSNIAAVLEEESGPVPEGYSPLAQQSRLYNVPLREFRGKLDSFGDDNKIIWRRTGNNAIAEEFLSPTAINYLREAFKANLRSVEEQVSTSRINVAVDVESLNPRLRANVLQLGVQWERFAIAVTPSRVVNTEQTFLESTKSYQEVSQNRVSKLLGEIAGSPGSVNVATWSGARGAFRLGLCPKSLSVEALRALFSDKNIANAVRVIPGTGRDTVDVYLDLLAFGTNEEALKGLKNLRPPENLKVVDSLTAVTAGANFWTVDGLRLALTAAVPGKQTGFQVFADRYLSKANTEVVDLSKLPEEEALIRGLRVRTDRWYKVEGSDFRSYLNRVKTGGFVESIGSSASPNEFLSAIWSSEKKEGAVTEHFFPLKPSI